MDTIAVLGLTESRLGEKLRLEFSLSSHANIFFEFEGVPAVENPGDLILLTLITEAMGMGSNISLPDDLPVSEGLLINLNQWQYIYSHWYKQLQAVDLHVSTKPQPEPNPHTICLYSGGADSAYTFLKNFDDISHLLFCYGADIRLDEVECYEKTRELNTKIAEEFNKQLIVVTTNVRDIFSKYDALINHGSLFAAQSLAVNPSKLFIPASHTLFELFPWGSHPLTDPLMSNGSTKIVHDGPVKRSEKISAVCENTALLNSLRVCNASEYFNCGECEKCLRTMFALAVIEKESDALPSLSSNWRQFKDLKIYKRNQLAFWQDNHNFALEHGKFELAKESYRICKRRAIRDWIKRSARFLTGSYKERVWFD